MSKESGGQNGDGGANNQNSQNNNNNQEETVPKSHADKILSEKKKLADEKKQLQDRLDAIEREKLEKEGKSSELVDKLKKDLDAKDSESKTFKNKIVQDRARFAAQAEATKLGFKHDSATLERLIDLAQIDVDGDSLEVSAKDVTKVITDLKTKLPELFKNAPVKPNDHIPKQGDVSGGNKSVNLANMKEDELKAELAKVMK